MKTSVAFANMAKALPYAAELLDCADVKAAKKLMTDEKDTSTGALLMQADARISDGKARGGLWAAGCAGRQEPGGNRRAGLGEDRQAFERSGL